MTKNSLLQDLRLKLVLLGKHLVKTILSFVSTKNQYIEINWSQNTKKICLFNSIILTITSLLMTIKIRCLRLVPIFIMEHQQHLISTEVIVCPLETIKVEVSFVKQLVKGCEAKLRIIIVNTIIRVLLHLNLIQLSRQLKLICHSKS